MAMPLEGIHVLEWGIWMAGPVAATCLGDLGAEVIKIEQPGTGDPMRGLNWGGVGTLRDGRHALYEAYNRNKRSMVIDLKTKKGQDLAHKLVKWADVFVHNFPRDTASKLGLDYQTLCQINPLLIYATASGFGQKGPDSNLSAFDIAGMARSGHMMALAKISGGDPQTGLGGTADLMAGFTLSHGILSALYTRERTGVGQEIEASLLGSMIYLQYYPVSFSLFFNEEAPLLPRSSPPSNPLYFWYRCKDDKWILILALQPDPFWPSFCRALGISELEKDQRFADFFKRQSNSAELIPILEKIFVSKTREEWISILRKNDLPYCPINSILDLPFDPQVVENDYIVNFQHPSLGSVKLTGFPVWFSKTPASVRREAPLHGQHTEEILQEVLGMSWEMISELKKEGVV